MAVHLGCSSFHFRSCLGPTTTCKRRGDGYGPSKSKKFGVRLSRGLHCLAPDLNSSLFARTASKGCTESNRRKSRLLPSIQAEGANLDDADRGSAGCPGNSSSLSEALVSRRKVIAVGGLVAGSGPLSAPSSAEVTVKQGTRRSDNQTLEDGGDYFGFLDNLRNRVSSFTLANGMRWVVLERHTAPVVSCHIYTRVGAADEAPGLTGIAHLLEHLAFKGTRQIGTRDAADEARLLDELDSKFYKLRDARANGESSSQLARLAEAFELAKSEAAELSIPNAYGALLGQQGGVGLNATTSQDSTDYFVSLPENKLELWMALESGRFIAPVFRELYSEKEVVKEERRMRVENSPLGRFTQAFAQKAFPSSPYGRPVIGYPEDLERMGRREVQDFFHQRYHPLSLTAAVVGDVDPQEVERLAEKYFGKWRAPPNAIVRQPGATWRQQSQWEPLLSSGEGPREIRMALPSSPFYMEGYLRPSSLTSDGPVLSVLADILSGGRTSRLYKNLIIPGKALSAQASEAFPADERPCLFLLSALPFPDQATDQVAAQLHGELRKLATTPVTEAELAAVKKAARASFLNVMRSNQGMAGLLAEYEAVAGTWENLLEEPRVVNDVTREDVLRVSSLLFQSSNRVSGHVTTGSPSQA